ncbi:hypothetical protein [Nitrospirillum sp. BR 11163]|uniref:hypothetical protein n=1 Tax=Nitrospirillum sp. BR 11163 TaxID=3104323 RepID=UPI002AFE48E2|nr:hypothetical protein [Nitrospirillum sp. BR 11163]MEA1675584.1 hypothetical protein [Nitrospirillum sp. BR 11163]
MRRWLRIASLLPTLLAAGTALAAPPTSKSPASTPPMGWNSWDAYGFTIDEADFKANAGVLATLTPTCCPSAAWRPTPAGAIRARPA